MRAGKRLLVYSLVLFSFLSCRESLEINDLSNFSWYDFEYDKSTLTIEPEFDFLNEVFLEITNDSIILVEIFANEIPTSFIFYTLTDKVGKNKWSFTNNKFDLELELEISRDTNLIITRPLLNDEKDLMRTIFYFKQSETKNEIREIFLDYDKFKQKRRQRQYNKLEAAALKYHKLQIEKLNKG